MNFAIFFETDIQKTTRQPLLLSTILIDDWYGYFYVANKWKLCIGLRPAALVSFLYAT